MATQVNEDLLRKIDQLELSDRIQRWQKAMKACPSQIYVDGQKFALESWKETEGEDIEIRRAKLFKKIVDNVPIKIHDFDVLVGRLTPGVIGASTAMDIVGVRGGNKADCRLMLWSRYRPHNLRFFACFQQQEQ
jgi:hypothetical protein